MNLNNKGFAISSIMYIILVLAIILISLTLAIFSSRRLILDNQKNDALHEIYQDRFKNGDVVYFDVSKGIGCTEEEYKASYDETTLDYLNSKTGYNGFNNKTSETDTTLTDKLEIQNSCLKFYAFNDDGGDSINLLLDHNTTAELAWRSSNSNISGPGEVLVQLQIDTSKWKGTLGPLNYSLNQGEGYANYEIDYSGYNARLITAGEIAQITGNIDFNEFNSDLNEWYYLDSKTSISSTTCKNGDTSGCKYGWLYDKSYIGCVSYGCLNNCEVDIWGYWTSTSVSESTSEAWYVRFSGNLYHNYVGVSDVLGVRPVITVLREKIL